MQKRILPVGFFMLFFPLVSLAAFRPVVTLSSGFATANVYSSKIIAFSPYQNSYVGSNHYDSAFDTGLFVGAETTIFENWAWQIGLSYYSNSSFSENGNVDQFADPAYNNLIYQYQIDSKRLSIETNLSHVFHEIWHPYVSVGAGKAFNRAYSYMETPVTSADIPMTQPFGNHSTNSFTYSFGLGVYVNATDHFRIGLGYRFVNLGNASLAVTPLQSDTHTLANTNIHANEILAQISYVG